MEAAGPCHLIWLGNRSLRPERSRSGTFDYVKSMTSNSIYCTLHQIKDSSDASGARCSSQMGPCRSYAIEFLRPKETLYVLHLYKTFSLIYK